MWAISVLHRFVFSIAGQRLDLGHGFHLGSSAA